MATQKSTQSATPSRARADVINQIDRRLTQLNALLSGCYGFGQAWLDEMGPESRDHIMWLAADLAKEAQIEFDQLVSLGVSHG